MNPPENFSNLQWYLAHARNSVHFTTYLKRKITADEFDALVDLVISRAPQMLWRENLDQSRHEQVEHWQRGDHIEYIQTHKLPDHYSRILIDSAAKIHHATGPAFHVICHVADKPDANGNHTMVSISVSHTVMEGLDLSTLTRAHQTRDHHPELITKSAPILQRIGALTLAPIVGLFHLVSANLQKVQAPDFGFASLSVDKAKMRQMAKTIGVSQRSLYFAIILFYLHANGKAPKKNRMIAYSSLKENHIAQERDAFLRLKMHVLFVKQETNFVQFAKTIDHALKKQAAGGNFNQHLYDKVLAFHRLIYPIARPLFSQKFFTYIPYDMVLSLLPPVKPVGELSYLNEGPLFGSSYTQGGENCIIVPGRKFLTFNFWAKQETLDAVKNLQSALAEKGVASEITR